MIVKTTGEQALPSLPVEQWHALFATRHPKVERFLLLTYGDDAGLRDAKRDEYLTALDHYTRNYGPGDDVFIVRSPGRINLMGSHVDHRGGDVNVVAISDECIAVVSPRDDDIVELSNSMPDRFADNTFSIGDLAASLDMHDWNTCVNSPKTLALVNDGDWDNYIKAATMRLQQRFSDRKLRGMRMCVQSNIPIGSGLSSSSAIVVATAEACVAVNDLDVQPNLLVDLCGEGEWFVGTRGGSGDHAAIKLGRRGEVANIGFFPFEVKGFVPFPEGYRIVIVNSGVAAKKMKGARARYNATIFAYVIGEALFKLTYPEHADKIQHLRDISPEHLGVSDSELYSMLRAIPEMVSYRADIEPLWDRLGKMDRERIEGLLATAVPEDEPLEVRNILLYGVSEVRRSRLCSEFLAAGELERFGRMAYTSHDGDRVVWHDDEFKPHPWTYQATDSLLQQLESRANSEEPSLRETARLHWQPGRYACSIPKIDLIVDIARRMPGVLGAQIAGAGLGGCAMAFVEEDRCEEVVARYRESGFEARVYSPVQGADVVDLG